MTKPHRIAAGAIIINNGRILLVRYKDAGGGSYLVAPGGALETDENAFQAAARETLEETGVVAVPKKVLFIEDLLCRHFKMCKIWILCDASTSEVKNTSEARAEGIIEARWFDREQLEKEVVFPTPIKLHCWEAFLAREWELQCLAPQVAGF